MGRDNEIARVIGRRVFGGGGGCFDKHLLEIVGAYGDGREGSEMDPSWRIVPSSEDSAASSLPGTRTWVLLIAPPPAALVAVEWKPTPQPWG